MRMNHNFRTSPRAARAVPKELGSVPTLGHDLKLVESSNAQFTSSVPNKSGTNWDYFLPLAMTGVVYSALLNRTPVDISSVHASIYQALGETRDVFTATFPLKILNIYLTVDAQISLPAGTLTKPLIHPFVAVELSPDNAAVTYTDTTGSTALAIAEGTLLAELSDTANITHTPRAGQVDVGDEASALVPRIRRFGLRTQ